MVPPLGAFLAALLLAGTALAAPLNRATLAERPPEKLSAFGLFVDAAASAPAPGVIGYDLATPLFSDYAAKDRFVVLPSGRTAAYREDGVFDFPVGTTLVKTFSMPADLRAPEGLRRKLETRLLIRTQAGWKALPYVWDAAGSEARLAIAGVEIALSVIDQTGAKRSLSWSAPNMNQCKGCHALGDAISPIGPKADNLDFSRDGEGQLARWVRLGLLDRAPEGPARAVRFDDEAAPLSARARAYLDVNCAHCHNPQGPASNSGLDLRRGQADPHRLGVGKRPVAAGRGSGGLAVSIKPGDPDASLLVYRLASDDPGVMMPELGRTLVHAEGLALIRQWIADMDQD